MSVPRPFRFGAGGPFMASSAAEWAALARRVEALGYATLVMADHLAFAHLAPTPALAAAAAATTTLRLGTTVYVNDFRHPAILAKDVATLDVLSDGRIECGIGTGWLKSEFEAAGIPFAPPDVRVGRLEEAVGVLKALWTTERTSFTGRYFRITGLTNTPTPVQRPHPPLFIGGGGKRLLSFAGREADIVGLIARAKPEGRMDLARDSDAVLAEKVGWVRAAAGERFAQLELAVYIWRVVVTDDRAAAAEAVRRSFGLTVEQVLGSPYFLLGSVDAIVGQVEALRARHGISYICVFPIDIEAFAPVVSRLAGR